MARMLLTKLSANPDELEAHLESSVAFLFLFHPLVIPKKPSNRLACQDHWSWR